MISAGSPACLSEIRLSDRGLGDKETVWCSSGASGLSENGTEGLSQRGLLGRGQSAKFFEHGW